MRIAAAWLLLTSAIASAQILPLPPRATNAPTGNAFAKQITSLGIAERDQEVAAQILGGNVPDWMRRLDPVTVSRIIDGGSNSLTFFVTADYLGVGTEDDFFRAPMMPMTAQRIADRLGCVLPTRVMVDAIYNAAEVKLAPQPISPSAAMTTVPVFIKHNEAVQAQLAGRERGELVAGDQKDVVVSARLEKSPGKVAIYGWHGTNGVPIQPLFLGHSAGWVDYSHGVRLVDKRVVLNGTNTTVEDILADGKLCSLLSDEGVVANPRYDTNPIIFLPTGSFGEHVATFKIEPDTRVQINEGADFAPGRPMLLIFYALPNGNTIEETVGRGARPGDDWHFGIQQIGAQTRFLRGVITNQAVVVAYLQAESLSWPSWRAKHGDGGIPGILASVKHIYEAPSTQIVLAGHSGGGSLIFGYLNTVEKVPADVRRIAFLDSDYAYDSARGHGEKLAAWLKASADHVLCVLAYNDAIARLDGQPFVTVEGGTWGRSHAMLRDLATQFDFTSTTNGVGLERYSALDGRVQFLLHENTERKILHTVQVQRNGFIQAILAGTAQEGRGYEYFGPAAYTNWIAP
jgi:hypothetical protein